MIDAENECLMTDGYFGLEVDAADVRMASKIADEWCVENLGSRAVYKCRYRKSGDWIMFEHVPQERQVWFSACSEEQI